MRKDRAIRPQHKLAVMPPSPAVSSMVRARLHDTIESIGADAWNACYPGELEDYAYLLAVERSAMPGFSWRYITLEENGAVMAAAPAFFTDYRLDSTLEGWPKKIIGGIRTYFPRFLVMKLACIGSPATECGYVGFHESVGDAHKKALLQMIVQAFEEDAAAKAYHLIGAKDVPEQQKFLWDAALHTRGFRAISSMATARLDIDFVSMDGYFARLSHATRKDMRRKLKAAGGIRIEHRRAIDDVLPQVMALYRDTHARSEFSFEELTQDYFTGVLAQCGQAFCMLYYAGGTLLAANLMLADKTRLLDKFFCMNGSLGREHNLYFLSWFTNLQYCITHGIAQYQSGQAGYDNKLRLRSRLTPNWLMFKHTNPLLGALLRLAAPLLAMEEA